MLDAVVAALPVVLALLPPLEVTVDESVDALASPGRLSLTDDALASPGRLAPLDIAVDVILCSFGPGALVRYDDVPELAATDVTLCSAGPGPLVRYDDVPGLAAVDVMLCTAGLGMLVRNVPELVDSAFVAPRRKARIERTTLVCIVIVVILF